MSNFARLQLVGFWLNNRNLSMKPSKLRPFAIMHRTSLQGVRHAPILSPSNLS